MMARKISSNEEELDMEAIAEVMDVTRVRVPDVITLTARLAQILAEEADHLEAMNITRVGDLQKEKIMLINALEALKKQVAKHPELMDEITEEEREDLEQVVNVFYQILEENYRRLSMARSVNQRVVQAITDAVQEATRGDVYDRKGEAGKPVIASLSMSLNEKV
jgi:flagellar biosynthesis/type III secretory pathway chaperone